MNTENTKKIQWSAKLFPDIALCSASSRASLITSFKQKALNKLLEAHPNTAFMKVYFEVQNAQGKQLQEAVDYFRRGDRFLYDGEFMSRQKLESIISELPAALTMLARIKESQ